MDNLIEINGGGIECDNPNCDWVDSTIHVSNYEKWIDVPCPKCGENVMTREDYNTFCAFLAAAKIANDFPDLFPQTGEVNTATVKIHNGITITETKE